MSSQIRVTSRKFRDSLAHYLGEAAAGKTILIKRRIYNPPKKEDEAEEAEEAEERTQMFILKKYEGKSSRPTTDA